MSYVVELNWNQYYLSLIFDNLSEKTFSGISQLTKELLRILNLYDSNKKAFSVSNIENTASLISYYEKLKFNYDEVNETIKGYDLICQNLIASISNLAVFKFFFLCSNMKIKNLENKHEDKNKLKLTEDLMKPLNNILHELEGTYLKYEVAYIKQNFLLIFFQDCKKNLNIEALLDKNYYELIEETQISIDDYFYTLKIAGNRAIESFDLQYCLTIFNVIKDVILDDLKEILQNKFGNILKIKGTSGKLASLSYSPSCVDPCLSSKQNKSNLYVIICLNSIVQAKENSILLLEEAQKKIMSNYFSDDSKSIFNYKKIIPQVNESPAYTKELETYLKQINSNKDLVYYSLDIEGISKQFDGFLTEKISSLVDDILIDYIKTSSDLLNKISYNIDSKNSLSAELTESFSSKFVAETEIILKQWKNQMNELCFNKFIIKYCSTISIMIEKNLLTKKFSPYGIIILEKDLNKIVNFFSSKSSTSIREKFLRLITIANILNLENSKEVDDFISNGFGCNNDVRFSRGEIERILKLKIN